MRFNRLMLLGVVVGTLTGSLAYAEEDRYFITNKAGVTIDELYVSATSTKSWGKDILGKETLDNGETTEIIFHPDDERCMWDVAIKDTDGNRIEWSEIDLCKYTKVILKPDGVAELK
ncbi:conserved hypothetical protein [Gammaproteobacteria bacterium]